MKKKHGSRLVSFLCKKPGRFVFSQVFFHEIEKSMVRFLCKNPRIVQNNNETPWRYVALRPAPAAAAGRGVVSAEDEA